MSNNQEDNTPASDTAKHIPASKSRREAMALGGLLAAVGISSVATAQDPDGGKGREDLSEKQVVKLVTLGDETFVVARLGAKVDGKLQKVDLRVMPTDEQGVERGCGIQSNCGCQFKLGAITKIDQA